MLIRSILECVKQRNCERRTNLVTLVKFLIAFLPIANLTYVIL
jgi:hypothetical protein